MANDKKYAENQRIPANKLSVPFVPLEEDFRLNEIVESFDHNFLKKTTKLSKFIEDQEKLDCMAKQAVEIILMLDLKKEEDLKRFRMLAKFFRMGLATDEDRRLFMAKVNDLNRDVAKKIAIEAFY